jgi:hypothetical protein
MYAKFAEYQRLRASRREWRTDGHWFRCGAKQRFSDIGVARNQQK